MLPVIPESNQNPSIGFTYEITNPMGVKSYLIGTCHRLDAESIRKSNFETIVDKCSALYTEVGTDFFVTSAQGSIPEGNHKYTHIKYRFVLDDLITLRAWCNRIPIISLDKDIPGVLNQVREYSRKISLELGPDIVEELVMKDTEEGCKQLNVILTIKIFQQGNIGAAATLRDNTDYRSIAQREDRWFEILLPELRKTQKPICIAVGYAHVVGYNNIVDRFKKDGFKVELITPTCSAVCPELFSPDGQILPTNQQEDQTTPVTHRPLNQQDVDRPIRRPSCAKKVTKVIGRAVRTVTSFPRSRL